jgi:hypothetical protein
VRRVPFSCFTRPDSFSTVLSALGLVFMFCAPGLIFVCTERVWSRFLVLCSRASFLRYRGRRVSFSCFALQDSLSVVPRASRPVFMFSAPGHVFGGTEGVRSRFHVLRTRVVFGGIKGVGSRFHFLRSRTSFRRYRGRGVAFSYFALPDSFLPVPRASGPVFMFCAPETHFRRYRWRRVPFSCFACPDSFSAL